jgi:hypothetical protein
MRIILILTALVGSIFIGFDIGRNAGGTGKSGFVGAFLSTIPTMAFITLIVGVRDKTLKWENFNIPSFLAVSMVAAAILCYSLPGSYGMLGILVGLSYGFVGFAFPRKY